MPQFILYSRSYCHLCDDMIAGLQEIRARVPFELEVVDVDANPELEARYGELVPVLVGPEGELCHYHLDRAKVDDCLSKIG